MLFSTNSRYSLLGYNLFAQSMVSLISDSLYPIKASSALLKDKIDVTAFMMWLVENNIAPLITGREFYRADTMSWTCGFELQIPLNSRVEVTEWVELFRAAGWKSADKDDAQDKDRVGRGFSNKGNYLQFKFHPDEELLKVIKEKFDYEFKYVKSYGDYMRTFSFSEWTVDLHLEFYPTNTADCQITDLGKAKQEREVQVWEVTCKEGAEEMAVIMNGGDDA